MRIVTILVFILFGINLLCQSSGNLVLSERRAISILKEYGIDSLKIHTQPINLVYLNELNSRAIIDHEFSKGFTKPHYDSSGIYTYDLPTHSIEIATYYKNEYAAQKIFEYYKALPKHIRSDTIYNAFIGLDDLLSLLVFYKPKGLELALESDFYEWKRLSQKTPPKIYKTIDEYRHESATKSFADRIKINDEDLVVDCNFVSFQIAEALNKLGNNDFNTDFLLKLKATQAYVFIDHYRFPMFYNDNLGEQLFTNNYKTIALNDTSITMKSLVKNPVKLAKLLYQKIENCCDSTLSVVLHNDTERAYVEFSRNNGLDAYIIKLENNQLFIQGIWSILE